MEKNLNLFSQFLVRYPDNDISEYEFELSLFTMDSLLHVMNFSLPIQQCPEAIIQFTDSKTCPEIIRSQKIIYLATKPNLLTNTCYQLAHEICHYTIPNEVASTLRWLEETICELASCYFLPEISKYWKRINNPMAFLEANTSCFAFEDYIEGIIEKIHPLNLKTFCTNSSKDLLNLEEHCELREYNRYIALQLLPIFQHFPEAWHAVPLLSELSPTSQPLLDALKQWLTLAPTESCIALQEVAQLFGAAIPLN